MQNREDALMQRRANRNVKKENAEEEGDQEMLERKES